MSHDNFLIHLAHQAFAICHNIGSYVQTHPLYVGVAVIGTGLPIFSALFLPILGFSTLGPSAGSIAAGWHASIENVAAGSLFSTLLSAGMGGAAAGIFTGIGVTGGVVTVGATAAMVIKKLSIKAEDVKIVLDKFAPHVWDAAIKATEEAKSIDLVGNIAHAAKVRLKRARRMRGT